MAESQDKLPRGVLGRAREFCRDLKGSLRNRRMEPVDPRVRYPSYKSLDEFIDVERLRSLDSFVSDRVRDYLGQGKSKGFDTGILKQEVFRPRRAGSRVLELSAPVGEYSYFQLSEPDLWAPTPLAQEMQPLMDFIATLPFERTARMIIMCSQAGAPVTAHRDHANVELLHEFVWFRTNLRKPFFVTDTQAKSRAYLDCYSSWFDTVNQFHGADAIPELSVSLRVDGVFTQEFRSRIPTPPYNKASMPSLWASS